MRKPCRYLEKIIQVPFELPKVDQATLLQALFVRLDAVMAPTPEGRFQAHYWTNVFYSGLHRLFTVPRDIVRLTNALSVTYPAVVGEVNPVDFIAIECLRVFLPSVYDAIRTSPEQFCGYKAIGDRGDKERATAFHDAWLQKVPEDLRDSTQELVQRLFPRLESVWSNMHYSGDSLQQWRAKLQVCVPEIFPAYFRLSLPAGTVTRADVDALLAATKEPAAFANLLRDALAQKTARGTSKARALLERLMDHVPDDLGPADARSVITALLDMGDELLVRTDKVAGEFDFGNESRVSRVTYHLLKKVGAADRREVVASAISTGRALRCGQYLIGALADEVDKEAKGEGGQALVRVDDVEGMKSAWLTRVEALACEPSFIDHPSLARLLSVWRHWGDESHVKAWWAQASGTDEGLAKLITAFQSESTSHGFGNHSVRVHLRVNPKAIEPYDDVYALAARAQALVEADQVPEAHAAAVKRFVIECERMKAGKNPDDFDFDDQ